MADTRPRGAEGCTSTSAGTQEEGTENSGCTDDAKSTKRRGRQGKRASDGVRQVRRARVLVGGGGRKKRKKGSASGRAPVATAGRHSRVDRQGMPTATAHGHHGRAATTPLAFTDRARGAARTRKKTQLGRPDTEGGYERVVGMARPTKKEVRRRVRCGQRWLTTVVPPPGGGGRVGAWEGGGPGHAVCPRLPDCHCPAGPRRPRRPQRGTGGGWRREGVTPPPPPTPHARGSPPPTSRGAHLRERGARVARW